MFSTLPGFRDFYPEECARRNYLFQQWRRAARSFGFQEYDCPVLEPLELYLEKSGEEIAGQLFNFSDKGGRAVALRPELTPSLARMVGARAGSLKRPVKWYNIGENFRYEKPQKGRLRSFYQLNADIFGEPGPGADAELMALCLECLTVLGLGPNDVILRLSDRHLWMHYLAGLGLDPAGAVAVLAIVDKMEREEEPATVAKLRPLLGSRAEEFPAHAARLTALRDPGALAEFFGSRQLSAEAGAALQNRLDEWRLLWSGLEAFGLAGFVQLDLGIVRGLAYYTGFVFEAFERSAQGSRGRALAGGGRYDNLVGKLGYNDLHAAGFAIGDVTVTDLLLEKHLLPLLPDTPDVYAILGGPAERAAGLRLTGLLRRRGWRVEYALRETGFGKQFKAAGQSGARFALIVGSEELAAGQAKVRDLSSGGEATVRIEHLPDFLDEARALGLPATQT